MYGSSDRYDIPPVRLSVTTLERIIRTNIRLLVSDTCRLAVELLIVEAGLLTHRTEWPHVIAAYNTCSMCS